eukprot:CAMPEP_0202770730 /NCGR_PEP_ID=MMETSP1388-20130828/39425_1 /ASSEMBLY_ACC=CAM_ASM_000864 /TAXON_ID=37098 /ORGANISM="Isochrysis sp, Strain CCMP1244" /LENGTH=186 /DNA_ID=CAMNT_0049439589 /DNA_START=100 /DNA_END=656 /DNA_ORIENTATION=-
MGDITDATLRRRLDEQKNKIRTGESSVEDCKSQAAPSPEFVDPLLVDKLIEQRKRTGEALTPTLKQAASARSHLRPTSALKPMAAAAPLRDGTPELSARAGEEVSKLGAEGTRAKMAALKEAAIALRAAGDKLAAVEKVREIKALRSALEESEESEAKAAAAGEASGAAVESAAVRAGIAAGKEAA